MKSNDKWLRLCFIRRITGRRAVWTRVVCYKTSNLSDGFSSNPRQKMISVRLRGFSMLMESSLQRSIVEEKPLKVVIRGVLEFITDVDVRKALSQRGSIIFSVPQTRRGSEGKLSGTSLCSCARALLRQKR